MLYRDFKIFDEDIFNQELRTSLYPKWVHDYISFEDNFLGVWNKNAPLKKKVLRANHVLYVTKALRKTIMKRSYLEKLYFNKRPPNLWKSIRNNLRIFVVDYTSRNAKNILIH